MLDPLARQEVGIEGFGASFPWYTVTDRQGISLGFRFLALALRLLDRTSLGICALPKPLEMHLIGSGKSFLEQTTAYEQLKGDCHLSHFETVPPAPIFWLAL